MLILASASPRRKELLSQLGFPFTVIPADIDESILSFEHPEDYVQRLAEEKASSLLAQFPEKIILAADTTVVSDQQILGKPANKEEAFEMWQLLGNGSHQVYTGLTVMNSRRMVTQLVSTEVIMQPLSQSQMEWYWHTGEPLDKAGGYGIQGLGGQFIKQINGSYSNVVGLPLVETAQALAIFGLTHNTAV